MKQNFPSTETLPLISSLSRRSFLHHAGALSIGGLLLDACKTKDSEVILATGTPIACYGDSLTDGFGGTKISTLLAAALPGRIVENYGISGQTAQQIAARQGGKPLLLTLEGNTFSGTASVKITSLSDRVLSTPDSNDTSTLTGKLGGINCTMTRTATGDAPNQIEIRPLLQALRLSLPIHPFILTVQKRRNRIVRHCGSGETIYQIWPA